MTVNSPHYVGQALTRPNAAKCSFAECLRSSRQKLHKTQQDLADGLEINRVLIANYEKGKATPEPDRAVRLAQLLGQDPAVFLLLAALQRGAQESLDPLLLNTVMRLLDTCGAGVPRPPVCTGLTTHLSLLDFPASFAPITVIVGDKREDEPKNAGDLFVFSASSVDDRWLLRLGLPSDTEKLSDKVLMTADPEWLTERLGRTNILCIGSPASNLFARDYNPCFLHRFAVGKEAEHKWREKRDRMLKMRTPAALLGFREESRPDLRQTMRLFKQPGFIDFNYAHLKLGIDPLENRDFAVVSLGQNPFATRGDPYFAILAAGVHHPGTSHAVRFLSDPTNFEHHPFGGILEVQVPSDACRRDEIGWHNKIERSIAAWHLAGGESLKYTPAILREKLTTTWIPKFSNENVITDVAITVNELERYVELIDLLASVKKKAINSPSAITPSSEDSGAILSG